MVQLDNDLMFSEEEFAAWLDGTLAPEEETAFMDACSFNPDLQDLLDINDQVDETYEDMVETGFDMPEEFLTGFNIPMVSDLADDIYSYESFGLDEATADDMKAESMLDGEECDNDDSANDDIEENPCLDLALL